MTVTAPVLSTPPPTSAPSTPSVGPPPGTVDPKGVKQTVKTHGAEVQACFDRARMEKPDLTGKVAIQATLSPSGSVTSAAIGVSTVGSGRLESCVLAAFKSWTFPAPSGGVGGSTSYTFVFQ